MRMRTKKEVQEAIRRTDRRLLDAFEAYKSLIEAQSKQDNARERLIGYGVSRALKWVLGMDDPEIGPTVSVGSSQTNRGGRPRVKLKVDEVRRLRASGMHWNAIARMFRCSRATIWLYLKEDEVDKRRGGGAKWEP